MYTKEELLNLYNMDLDSLLKESQKYLKEKVEFCSIITSLITQLLSFNPTIIEL